MADLIRRSDVIGLLEDMLLFGEYDIIASSFSKADEEKAYRAINDIPAVNRWIPCSERMPEAGMSVLIYACKHSVTAYYDNCKNLFRLTENDNLYYIAEYVTHWMPLPEPPKEDDND